MKNGYTAEDPANMRRPALNSDELFGTEKEANSRSSYISKKSCKCGKDHKNKKNTEEDKYTEAQYKKSREEFKSALEIFPTGSQFMNRLHVNIFILGIVLVSYFLGRFRCFSLAIGLIYALSQFFDRRYKRYENSMKALIYQTTRREKAKDNFESVEWMNNIISRVWHVLEPEVSKEVFRSINPILQEKCPPFLSQLKLTTFTLGSTPPSVQGIMFFDESDPQVITFECNLQFIPMEIGRDAYCFISKSSKYQWNSKIVLIARLGTKVRNVGLDLPVLVKGISFSGRLRTTIRLVQDMSLVSGVEISFMEAPAVDFTLVPLKTVDLMDVPLLSNWINAIIKSTMSSVLVNPNSIKVDLRKKKEQRFICGVLYIYIKDIKFKSHETGYIELEVDGKRVAQTQRLEGEKIGCYEYFYLILENTNTLLGLRFVDNPKKGSNFKGEGYVDLRKIIMLRNHFESKRIYKNGNVRALANLHMFYLPFEKFSADADLAKNKTPKPDEASSLKQENGQKNNRNPQVTPENTKKECDASLCAENDPKKQTVKVDNLLCSASFEDNEEYENNAPQICKRIVRMKIVGIEDLRGKFTDKKKIFSPYFTVFVRPKIVEKIISPEVQRNPLNIVTGTVSATANFVGGAISSAGNAIGNFIPLGTEPCEGLMPSSNKTLFYYKSKVLTETNSPLFNESFEFLSRDIRNDFLYLSVHDCSDNSSIGELNIPICDLQSGEVVYKLRDCQSGDLRISTEIFEENKEEKISFESFEKAVKIEVASLVTAYDDGVFFMIVENCKNMFYVDQFCVGDFWQKQEVVFPADGDFVKIKVYKENLKENDFIGECTINTSKWTNNNQNDDSDTSSGINSEALSNYSISNSVHENLETQNNLESKSISKNLPAKKQKKSKSGKKTDYIAKSPFFNELRPDTIKNLENSKYKKVKILNKGEENGELYIFVESTPLYQYKGTYSSPDDLRIIQTMFKSFKNVKDEFFVEFYANNELILRSLKSENKRITNKYTFLAGKEEIRAVFKSAKQGRNKVLGDCLIPKRQMKDPLLLNEITKFSTNIHINVSGCNFKKIMRTNQGLLELTIIKINNLPAIDNNTCDPFVKIFLNGSKLYKTEKHQRTVNPKFNESVTLSVKRMTDVIRIEVFDHNRIEKNTIIAFREFPLYFLNEGVYDFVVKLVDMKTFKKSAGEIFLKFNFCKEGEQGKKYKSAFKTID
ncbi:hypothetical protein EDEG_00913 [Edhazardia aedis USNM 41457]|uniref:C2 domain-containing protein n=1 Tax=Edhazardia aedis (strain USNM 41457) TaxID=1003232 RepID=J9DB60_EDHAE|nr:hypothetical protein EDEG_00913 [Edhazardia aedis USNM 41457]|eukprot:EJW04996.1 hypothetical protein EDEG_00913 [Edhazardia aedis USNM 41457]